MMRAKLQIQSVTLQQGFEQIKLSAVTGSGSSGPNGESEDNTYARYTPCADLTMSITNPALHGKFKPGQKFYVDFTEAKE